jgi:16S rRNA (adenine1518-N6/adenine1519-N6)-dimethyltransferase
MLLKLKPVTAIEIDRDLYAGLRVKFDRDIRDGKLTLLNEDIMEYRKNEGEIHTSPYDMIANLPYYIATSIILDALDDELCQNVLVMVQKEVAQKFCAKPKEKSFSSLSVLTSMVADAEYLFDVPSTAFTPEPKVTSAVFLIKKHSSGIDRKFSEFLKIAFSQPRKKLLKNLSSKYDKVILETFFNEHDMSLTLRPHEVDATTLYRLFSTMS